jgi:hypothetical protein
MTMTDFVRVTDPETGYGLSVPASVAEADGLTVLDEPAVDRNGGPLPASAPGKTGPSDDTPSDAWSAQDLRDWADAHGVDISTANKKDDVLAAIQKATTNQSEAKEAQK